MATAIRIKDITTATVRVKGTGPQGLSGVSADMATFRDYILFDPNSAVPVSPVVGQVWYDSINETLAIETSTGTTFFVTASLGLDLNELNDVDTTESKAVPVDADCVLIMDSEGSNIWKKITLANLKAYINTP